MAGANGTREQLEEDLADFRGQPRDEQLARIYQMARSGPTLINELHVAIGALTRETAMNTRARREDTSAVRAFTEALATSPRLAAAKPSSLPPPRATLPSYLDLKDEDITAVRELKEKTKVDMAIQARWATWGRRVVFAGAIIAALGTIGGAIGGAMWAIANYAHEHAR